MASRKIGALWRKETKDGKKYLSGVLQDLSGDIFIAVFPNDRKEKENQPDYQIVLSEKREQRAAAPRQQDDFMAGAVPSDTDMSAKSDEIDVEAIPF